MDRGTGGIAAHNSITAGLSRPQDRPQIGGSVVWQRRSRADRQTVARDDQAGMEMNHAETQLVLDYEL
jgi:hypothetical protein